MDGSRRGLITTAEAAALHDVRPSTIRSWVARGLLNHQFKVDGRPLYRVEDVDRAEMLARTRDRTGRTRRRIE